MFVDVTFYMLGAPNKKDRTNRYTPKPMRVVSLLAAGTEIVCGLGAADTLVGRSHECDNPPSVRNLPACTRPAFDVNVSSGQIDAEVRRRLKAGEPLFHVESDLIRDLRPDLVIAQMHCDVCAVTPGDVERAGCVVASQVVTLSAGSLASIYADIHNIASALGRKHAGEALVGRMQHRIQRVTQAVRDRRPPSLVMLEWTDPIFAMGNWGPELVEAANGELLGSPKGAYSTSIGWDQIRTADPDYLIVAPCGFDLPRAQRELPTLEALPGWFGLRAVKAGKAVLADGNRYFNRSGTTVVDTVEIIAEILHGHRSDHIWRGESWQTIRTDGTGAVSCCP